MLPVLAKLNRWSTLKAIQQILPYYSSRAIRYCLDRLIADTAVVVRGSSQATREAEQSAWQAWGAEARFFHFATKNVHRWPTQIDEIHFNRSLKRAGPPPPSIKRYRGHPRIELPDPKPALGDQFAQVLLNRRTHRRFGDGNISLEQLSVVLRLTWGFTGYIRWPGLGRLPVKTSPSGGARHSLEVYLWCSRVEGLGRGIYHYRPDRHHLELLNAGPVANRMAVLCGYQPWVRRCSVLFVMTSMIARVVWRYRFSRAYRVILLEAGHFCQTFCLAATWLGLASFCTAALYDEKIEKDLGLKQDEAVIYAAGLGTSVT
jgi:SagB-type dehydrogenase family enzyme